MSDYSDEELREMYPSMHNDVSDADQSESQQDYPSMIRSDGSPQQERTSTSDIDEQSQLAQDYPSMLAGDATDDDEPRATSADDDGDKGVPIDDQRLRQVANRLGLDSEGRAALAEAYREQQAIEAGALGAASARWAEQSKAEHSATALKLAQEVINQYGDADLIDYLDESGLGNHPGLIRLLVKAGRDIKHLTKQL